MAKTKKKWRECSMREAILHCRDRQIGTKPKDVLMPDFYGNADDEWFTDGTAVACMSQWSGPYSEVTPDIDADPPKWWIYD